MNSPKNLCSVVITTHAEGLILHKTLRSAFKSIIFAEKHGNIKSEIIIVKDRVVDLATLEVVENWVRNNSFPIIAYDVSFGSISLSRNYGIKKANGTFISILDGDDLYSENWIFLAITAIQNDIADIIHPEVVIRFPYDTSIAIQNASPESQYLIFEQNQWIALLAAPKKIFIDVPYIKDEGQFAYQDWLWNIQTLEKGYRHFCQDNTLMAVRQKSQEKSLWQNSYRLNKVVRPNSYFKNLIINKSNLPEKNIVKNRFSNIFLAKTIKLLNIYYPPIYNFLKKFKRKFFRKNKNKLSIIIRKQFKKLEIIEPLLQSINNFRTANYYFDSYLIDFIPDKLSALPNEADVSICFFGSIQDILDAEKNTSHIVKKNYNIITDSKNNSKQNHINLAGINISRESKEYLILRILLETKIDQIQIHNSLFAANLLLKYKNVLKYNRLIVRIKTPERNKEGVFQLNTTANKLLSNFDIITTIIITNYQFKRFIEKVYGIPKNKILCSDRL